MTDPSPLSLPSPSTLKQRLPTSPTAAASIEHNRRAVHGIVCGKDERFLVVVGPCSVHDEESLLDYARRLAAVQRRVAESTLLCLRVYLEKPRSSVGWKGFVHDPELDGSSDVVQGLERSRRLLLATAELGLGIASELLDPILAEYHSESLSWAAIGARTSESQIHRELASSRPFAVGFKNATDGNVEGAIHSVLAAGRSHTTFGIDAEGRVCSRSSAGNPASHVVLRGGRSGPNFDRAHVQRVAEQLQARQLPSRVMVDCSHGNSNKDHRAQVLAFDHVCQQLRDGSQQLLGAMLESHLVEGAQPAGPRGTLRYGQSITDACIDLDTTERLLLQLDRAWLQRGARRGALNRRNHAADPPPRSTLAER